MKKLLLLFILFFPALLFSQTLREFDLQEMSEQQIPVFVEHPNDAAFIFFTIINGFTVESSTGGVTSIQSEESKVMVFLKPERQILTLKAPGFIEKKLSIENLSAKQAKYFRLNGREDSYQPETGSAKITTEPIGCLLLISGFPEFKEKTPYDITNYEARKYRINLTKPEYFPLDTLIEIRAGIKQDLIFRLKSKFGTLSLKAPEKVKVKINGQREQDVGPKYELIKLPIGTYMLEVDDPRFDPLKMEVILESGKTELTDLPLVKKSGYLQISHPEKFSFTVNGESYSKESEPDIKEFPVGSYKAVVKRSGYKQVEFNFIIKKGEVVTWNPDFRPEMAYLNINSIPEGADVYLISDGKEKILGFTPTGKQQVKSGSLRLLIKKEGFPDQNLTINLGDEEIYDKTIRLDQVEKVEKIEKKPAVPKEQVALFSGPRFLFYGAWINTWFATDEFKTLEEEGTLTRSPLGFGLGYRQYLGYSESWIIDAQVFFSQSVKTTFSPPTDQLYLGGLSVGMVWSPLPFNSLKPSLLAGYSLVNLGQSAFAFPTGEHLITHQGFAGFGVDFVFENIVLGTEFRRSVFASGGRTTNQIQVRAGYGL